MSVSDLIEELVASYESEWSTRDELRAIAKERASLDWFFVYNGVSERCGLVQNQGFIA